MPKKKFFLFVRHMLLAAITLMSGSAAAAANPADFGLPQQVIVRFAEPGEGELHRNARATEAISDVSTRLGVRLSHVRQLATGSHLVRLHDTYGMDRRAEVAAAFRDNSRVLYAHEDALAYAFATPNDSRYSEQWNYYETKGGIRLPAAWDIANGTGVRVAVIDTGYQPHPDLSGNLIGGYDFISDANFSNDGNGRDSDARDPGDWIDAGECGATEFLPSSWHGTHVAGTVAAITNNSTGVAGVAHRAKVVPVRVLGRCGRDPAGLQSDIAEAIIWAAGGAVSGVPANSYPARVINLSLGGSGYCASEYQSAINAARSRGAVVVVAAGNNGVETDYIQPANCSGVINVAAIRRDGKKAAYSNYGDVVDLGAPGGDGSTNAANGILSTSNAGLTTPGTSSYTAMSGTSMAAPHVAGVAALMLSVNPDLTPDQVESMLKSTARPIPNFFAEIDHPVGAGIVNAAAAVDAALPQPVAPDLWTEYTGCSGYGSRYALWWRSNNSTLTVISWDLDYMPYGGSWTSYYNGSSTSAAPVIHSKTRFRVRANTNAGWTPFKYSYWLSNHCGPGGGLDPY